ncbi:5,10-methylenetetrahydrofolate reductase (NAD(P)) [Microlunatus sagamiharensis]|uniref:Methylenetetrahydrofolate reductase n=1 Tax=Microlunatus sagamiharensis TaxID=546874 RepID=A0A1H2MPV6_9ACTN|nr:methylenetetrahydrofolate reductase [Microlunatus sagamiharensis]SDU95287.1 5,10-methylenetetrahydrofolate reductase (NAD(P)) [Microlunatus sagamiharensis]
MPGPAVVAARPRLSRPGRGPTVAQLLEAGERPLVSFELFPAKDAEQHRQLWTTIRELESLGPDFVSVTYGASGSTRDRTVSATQQIAEQTTLRPMAHLTAASQSRDELRHVVGAYASVGINHIMTIRGDMPGGPTVPWEAHPDGLANATELVSLVAGLGDFCIGVAAFPDLHPQTRDADLDARLLVAKQRAGASFAITQLFFTAERYFDLVARVRALGSDLPIIPGIMPVTRISQIERFADLSGAALPAFVTDRLHEVEHDPALVRAAGVDLATALSEELLAGGAPGLHFITMNRSPATREIYARLRSSLQRK